MTIQLPDTTEWIKNKAPTPAFIQFLHELSEIANSNSGPNTDFTPDQIEFLNSLNMAGLSSSDIEKAYSIWVESTGANNALWADMLVNLSGSPSTLQLRNYMSYVIQFALEIYNKTDEITERQDKIIAALVEAGIMERS